MNLTQPITPSGNLPDNSAFPWSSTLPATKPPNPNQPPVQNSNPQVTAATPQPVRFPPPVQMAAAFPQTVVSNTPPAGNPPPPTNNQNSQNPAYIPPQQSSAKKKFPLLVVTGVVLVIITGFSGSYIYFKTQGSAQNQIITTPKITPPVPTESEPSPTINPKTAVNPFAQNTFENPFSNETAYTNPFGEDDSEISQNAYQNPFENATP